MAKKNYFCIKSEKMSKGPISQFIEHHYRHFNAAALVDAAKGYETHLLEGGKMLVSLAGAMSTAELGISLAEMIRQDKIAIISCTGANLEEDGKSLLHDYISVEELRACTTCNACVEECPVSISPLDIIVELRRSLVMEESNAPAEWNGMFSNIENNFAPWKFSPDDRDAWTNQA